MNLFATVILAFGMSMDAFSASVGKGATLHKPALRTGLIFRVIEAITPLIGWGWASWPVSILCAGTIGWRLSCWRFWAAEMVLVGWKAQPAQTAIVGKHSLGVLVATAIATSLDALAIGVGLAMLQVNIVHTALRC